jgi:hypothetical protein
MNAPNPLAKSMCCSNCFQHQWLKDFVRGRSTERGSCQFCGARYVRLLLTRHLSDAFRNVLTEYVHESYRAHEVAAGEHHWAARQLLAALQDDWGVFSSAVIENKNAPKLLEHILSDAGDPSGEALKRDSWVLRFSLQAMRNEWRFFDRMFPPDLVCSPDPVEEVQKQIEIPGTLENQVGGHLSHFAVLVRRETPLFRARPGCETSAGKPAAHQDMGPNPAHPSSRANTNRQYAMYLSEAERNALAEIRQPVGSMVSLGEFAVIRDLTVVDLCLSIAPQNPFVTENLPWMLDLTLLLARIADLMSKPAETRDDYFRTQQFANIARAAGYDGVRYPSALNRSERNLVLFAPGAIQKRASWANLLTDLGFQRK